MKIADLKLVLSELLFKTDFVPVVIGHTGIGKSQSAMQVAMERFLPEEPFTPENLRRLERERRAPYAALFLSLLQPEDLQGIPFKDTDEQGRTYITYGAPDLLPTVENVERGLFPEQGILIWEELNRAEVQTLNSCFELILSRRVHRHFLAPGWKQVALINPPQEGYDVGELDDALRARLVHIQLQPDADDWLQYEYGRTEERIDRDMLEFLQQNKKLLHVERGPVQLNIQPNERAWERAMEIRRKCKLPEHLMTEVLAGVVGAEAAHSFQAWIQSNRERAVPGKLIIHEWEKARPQLAAYLERHRFDLLMSSILDLVAYVSNCEETEGFEDSICKFGLLLPDELAMVLAKRIWSSSKKEILLRPGCKPLRKEFNRRYAEIESRNGAA